MEFLSVPIILDVLLIVMLGACIAYCVSLSRKLSVMRDAQQELHQVASQFDQAIVKSKLAVEDLKNTSEKIGGSLQKEIDDAQGLLEELKLINASSSRIADKIQQGVEGSGRKLGGVTDDPKPEEEPKTVVEPRTDAERELLQMLTKSK